MLEIHEGDVPFESVTCRNRKTIIRKQRRDCGADTFRKGKEKHFPP